MQKKYFLTFANSSYMNTERITNQILEFDIFDEILGLNENDISNFCEKHKNFMLKNEPGFGFWIWKPKIILDALEKMNDDDILVYCDAGMYANKNGIDRFKFYLDKLNTYSMVTFSTSPKYIAQQYVKNDVIMHYYPEFNNEWNVCNYAGLIILKKNKDTLNFTKDWLNLCENYDFIDKSSSKTFKDHSYYKGNDCDNGIFNLCLSKYKNIYFSVNPDEINININGYQLVHATSNINDIKNANWASFEKIPFQCRRLTPKFNYSDIEIKKNDAYFLSHNGLGDNITSIGAIRFLCKYYNVIYFLCKDIYKNNVDLLFTDLNVKTIAFDSKNEFNECRNIISNVEQTNDLFICGFHKNYLKSRITNKNLLNYKQNDENYSIKYNFIKSFYYDIGLDLKIYYNFFDILSTEKSKKLYHDAKKYKIIFLHTKASNTEVDFNDRITQFINNDNYIIICANKNMYDTKHKYHDFANLYVNEYVAYYIDIIKNASSIYIINSCFSCIVYPLMNSNRLNTNDIYIFDR